MSHRDVEEFLYVLYDPLRWHWTVHLAIGWLLLRSAIASGVRAAMRKAGR